MLYIIQKDTLRYPPARTRVLERIWPVAKQLAAEPWYVYEYHDEQKLPIGNRYGPLVHAFVSPYLNSFTEIRQFDTHEKYGILVGVVVVDANVGQALGAPYDSLHLSPGVNCVHLAHDRAQSVTTGWTAYITPAVLQDSVPCPHVFALADSLRVTARQPAGRTTFTDYPAVARIEEGIGEQQALGLKCLAAWCQISSRSFVALPSVHSEGLETGHALGMLDATGEVGGITDDGKRRRVFGWLLGEVNGWYDEQRIAMKDTQGQLRPSNMRASLVPAPGLNRMDDVDYMKPPGLFVHVATVWIADDPDPTSDFASKWHFEKGANLLWARKNPNGSWEGQVESLRSHVITPVQIMQHRHYDVAIPATARWKWHYDDEIIWWDCGAGACCEASR
ncbi:MAG TPA: hypothetical protein VHE78_14170 [Gemmatimonadaceae bacterium]|nr:hypothetical protein [Gemmatimonadaceae bacterium]